MKFTERDSGLMVPVEEAEMCRERRARDADLPVHYFDEYPTAWRLVHYDEIDASVRYRMVNTHVAEFDAREWFGRDENGVVLFNSDDCQPTTDLETASKLASGDVKWDGCANLSFHTEDRMRHLCGFEDLRKFTALIEQAYSGCARLLWFAGVWDSERVPYRPIPFCGEPEVWRHLHEAMTWITGEHDDSLRAVSVWRAVWQAKEAMAKAGVEVETLC